MVIDPLDDPEFVEIYVRDGRRISVSEFTALRRDRTYRFLARDRWRAVEVVTAWLGLDQGGGPDWPPMIFGTAVVGGDREIFAATESEARANHAALLSELAGA